jgi:hypothetical protein
MTKMMIKMMMTVVNDNDYSSVIDVNDDADNKTYLSD